MDFFLNKQVFIIKQCRCRIPENMSHLNTEHKHVSVKMHDTNRCP